jgi:release factor glutamine methyltransferase
MNAHELIMTSILGCRRIDMYTGRCSLSVEEQALFDDMISRLDHGEPLQYILGETEFLGLHFSIDQRVLIPRQETEFMAEALLKILFSNKSDCIDFKILDIGTGSGCLAITLVKGLKNSWCEAVDVSSDALVVARQNARANGVDSRIKFCCGDVRQLWSTFPAAAFDLVVSNPPYIPTSCLADLPTDVRHEPLIALDGGEDGLVFYREIIREAAGLLKVNGLLACEFWDGQDRELRGMFDQSWTVEFFKDLSGVYRFFIARKMA